MTAQLSKVLVSTMLLLSFTAGVGSNAFAAGHKGGEHGAEKSKYTKATFVLSADKFDKDTSVDFTVINDGVELVKNSKILNTKTFVGLDAKQRAAQMEQNKLENQEKLTHYFNEAVKKAPIKFGPGQALNCEKPKGKKDFSCIQIKRNNKGPGA